MLTGMYEGGPNTSNLLTKAMIRSPEDFYLHSCLNHSPSADPGRNLFVYVAQIMFDKKL
jgi:hypothetical protein